MKQISGRKPERSERDRSRTARAPAVHSSAQTSLQTRMVQMQRTIGNRAFGQWLTRSYAPPSGKTIQMMRDRDAFTGEQVQAEKQDELLGQIADRLEQYNEFNNENDADCQQRLHGLKLLDSHIHAWFNRFVTGKIDVVPNGPLLKSLLRESEAEHRELVKRIAENNELIPVDASDMQEEDVTTVRTIWRAIVEEEGNLLIRERTEGFRDRMLAAIAKLLQEPVGRKLIAELNKKQDNEKKQVIVSSDFVQELKGSGIADSGQNEAIPQRDLESNDKNYNFKPLADKAELRDKDPSSIPEYRGDRGDAAAFNQFLDDNRDQTYFKFDGEIYQTGQGTGSFVRIHGEGMKTLVGENNQEVVTPEFVTLGHELGHASRFLKGMTPDRFVGVDQFGVEGMADRQLWHNAEEYLNINAVENGLRNEHGIGKRKYHSGTLDNVNKMVLHERYGLRRDQLYEQYPWAARQLGEHPLASLALVADFVEPVADFADPVVVNELLRRLDELEPVLAEVERQKDETPDRLYDAANKAVKARMDKDEEFKEYRAAFADAFQNVPLPFLPAELENLYRLAQGRSFSLQMKAASLLEDVEFDF
ncbi:M91 family zinc metallopeptidase [Paenibacillus hodogayensis]|uniref:M91 family zinc metallopeptidase n=2 Tax=Paenibacillus hodogayensis TaxID=279208 RepID=A0ABV5W6Z2_9BACL